MKIKSLLLIIAVYFTLFNTTALYAKPNNDSKKSAINTLLPIQISDDGQWLLYIKSSGDNISQSYNLINTNTKKEVNFDYLAEKAILANHDIFITNHKSTFTIHNLNNSEKDIILTDVKHYEVDSKQAILYYISDTNQLIILDLKHREKKQIIEIPNASQFHLNENKSFLIYKENFPTGKIYNLNLKTLQANEIKIGQLKNLYWNLNHDHCAIIDQDNILYLLDLKENVLTKKLPLTGKVSNVLFYPNNDIFVREVSTGPKKYIESTFVDIWGSGLGSKTPSNYKPKEDLKIQDYFIKSTSNKVVALDPDFNYRFIPINNHIIKVNTKLHFDHIKYKDVYSYNILNLNTEEEQYLTDNSHTRFSMNFYPSFDNTLLLYQKGNETTWEVFNPKTNEKTYFEGNDSSQIIPFWSTTSNMLVFSRGRNLIKLDIEKTKEEVIASFKKGSSISIQNNKNLAKQNIVYYLVDTTEPIILLQTHNNAQNLFSLTNTKIKQLTSNTSNTQGYIRTSPKFSTNNNLTFVWTQENFNQPPTMYVYKNNSTSLLKEDSVAKEQLNWQKRKLITYKDKFGTELQGYLYYPKNYDKNKSYPMITIIYHELWGGNGLHPGMFQNTTYFNTRGYNRPLFLEHGYFVFTPATHVTHEGPGIAAVDCVEQAISEVLKQEPSIQKDKIGLTGHSFGAYKTSFIATQTDIFAAIISVSGQHDLNTDAPFRFSTHLNRPEYTRTETGQLNMQSSFAENPEKYLANSPLANAHKIKTPILLSTGINDDNVFWEQTRTMQMAITRHNSGPSIALFYKKSTHVKRGEEALDFTQRNLDWFDYFLKDNTSIEWIKNSI